MVSNVIFKIILGSCYQPMQLPQLHPPTPLKFPGNGLILGKFSQDSGPRTILWSLSIKVLFMLPPFVCELILITQVQL